MGGLVALALATTALDWGCSHVSLSPDDAADLARAQAAADSLERERAFDPARRQLTATSELTQGETTLSLRLRICALWQREGALAQARACYADLAQRAPDPFASLAAYHAALLAESADRSLARAELLGMLEWTESTDAGGRAIDLLAAWGREDDPQAGELAALELAVAALSRAPRTRPSAAPLATDLAVDGPGARQALLARAWVTAGQSALALGEQARAVLLLSRARAVAAGTVWADDAVYLLAQAWAQSGRIELAQSAYDELAHASSLAYFAACEDSTYRDDALLAAAHLHYERGEASLALTLLAELEEEYPTSRLQDDGAFLAAQILAAQGDRQALSRFLASYPESRHVPSARRLLAEP